MAKRTYKHYQKKEVPFDLISYMERVGQIQDEPLRKKVLKELGSLAYNKSIPKCKHDKNPF